MPQTTTAVAPPPTLTHTSTPVPAQTRGDVQIPMFGARGAARKLAAEVTKLVAENHRLSAEMERLGMLPVVALERRRGELEHEIATQTATLERQRQDHARTLEKQAHDADERMRGDRARADEVNRQLEDHLRELREQVVVTEESALLQEVGIYRYRHPLTDAIAYQDKDRKSVV